MGSLALRHRWEERLRSLLPALIGAGVMVLLMAVFAGIAFAQQNAAFPALRIELSTSGQPSDARNLIQILILLTLLTLAPALIIMVTPFTRIIIVLSLLRSALGTQQAPPNQVLIGLALFLTLFIMAPVNKQIYEQGLRPYFAGEIELPEAIERSEKPLRQFMLTQTRKKDLELFVRMAELENVETVDDVPTYVIIPAFLISELKTAFEIGFIIFVPFLIIDMVVSSILLSMGMLMLPPILISLPFKLLLFIVADGWNLIFGSLVMSFKQAGGL